MPTQPVPLPTLRRLPRYHQYLARLRDQGQDQVSAAHMADVLGVHHTQVRKDLTLAGCLGRPKTGHRVAELLTAIESFLHWDNQSDAFLVGAGSLGTALLKYPGFGQAGARIVAAFDHDPAKAGGRVGDIPVLPMDKLPGLAQRMHIAVGILTVPADAAQAQPGLQDVHQILAALDVAGGAVAHPDDILAFGLKGKMTVEGGDPVDLGRRDAQGGGHQGHDLLRQKPVLLLHRLQDGHEPGPVAVMLIQDLEHLLELAPLRRGEYCGCVHGSGSFPSGRPVPAALGRARIIGLDRPWRPER